MNHTKNSEVPTKMIYKHNILSLQQTLFLLRFDDCILGGDGNCFIIDPNIIFFATSLFKETLQIVLAPFN